jgi:predicted metalloendopeptidase
VKIARDDALGNFFRAEEFATQRVYDKIGKAPDPKEWSMTPPTVNAYYSPQQNNINFLPASCSRRSSTRRSTTP